MKPDQPPTADEKSGGFFADVFDVARQIPKGRVTSYGAIANYLGMRKSARMVGWAMGVSHNVKPKVPAHRVVNRSGLLTGKFHFRDIHEMENLLKKEGVIVRDDKVVNFKNIFWDPSIALDL